ncbi:MAG: solute:sodium symporter family transporter [Planctomycetota bacterium]|nr:solute:sodium symporter family transporter [Planctomycetota bacterium]
MNWTMTSFVLATAAVAVGTVFFVRRMKRSENAIEDYFAGGRSLAWPVVAGSLLLTNLSTEQLVGLNGAVFQDGRLVGIAWEVLSAFAMMATALLFLPKYLASGFTTTTGYLEQRYDRVTRRVVSALFLSGYVAVLLPVVLYTGALAVRGMFGLELQLWLVVVGIGILGSGYAIFGGLRAVAVSDTINGVGLLVGGVAVPLLALNLLGEGSVVEGLSILVEEKPETLNPLTALNQNGTQVSVPWPTLLTGMMFIQLFYWSTNQVIVQRAMGARDLKSGQQGLMFAASLKILGPVMLCLPGIIALHLTDTLHIHQADTVYPVLVRAVLPEWALGLFGAVIVGSILSSFNSALNSASTLFCIDFYRPLTSRVNDTADDKRVVAAGQIFAAGIAILAMIVAPLLAQMQSIFDYLQKVNGLYSVPIIVIFLMGILTRRANARGAKAAMAVGVLSYAGFTFADVVISDLQWPTWYHWLHGYGISVALAFATVVVFFGQPQVQNEDLEACSSPVDMNPWSMAKPIAVMIALAAVGLYASLVLLSSG